MMSLEMVTGPLSQALRLNRLREANLEDQVCGQDLILFNYVILCIHCVETLKNSVKFPLLNSVFWFLKPLTLLFCFRSVAMVV